MTDRDALYAAILARPHEDTPREVLADYLDDNSESDRAAYIRTGVEHTRSGKVECEHRIMHDPGGWNAPYLIRCGACDFCTRIQYLEDAGKRYAPDLPVGYAWTHEEDPDVVHRPPPSWPVIIFRRGFPDELRCDLRTFVGGECENCGGTGRVDGDRYEQSEPCPDCGGEYGPSDEDNPSGVEPGTGRTPGLARELFRLHPITRVVLTDREPRRVSDSLSTGWTWSREWSRPRMLQATVPDLIRQDLSRAKCQRLPRDFMRWDSREDAIEAASDALVDHGRVLAGIQPLRLPEPINPAA